MHGALTSHTRAFLEGYVRSKPTYREVMEAHYPILEAICSGDSEKSCEFVRRYISFSMKVYEDFVERKEKKSASVR
jgi:DNA-binding FadR family transcriptional regulator